MVARKEFVPIQTCKGILLMKGVVLELRIMGHLQLAIWAFLQILDVSAQIETKTQSTVIS